MSILVINSGSSSLKFGLFDAVAQTVLASGVIDWADRFGQAELVVRSTGQAPRREQIPVADHGAAVAQVVAVLRAMGLLPPKGEAVRVIGHRVVHGGVEFRAPTRIDAQVKAAIHRLAELAPLHNPPALAAIEGAEVAFPGVPQVAIFDTAFFADLPPRAVVYPLPYEWYADWGLRRFGFHGISIAYCTGRAAELLPTDAANLRLVICHLGNGCSATAVRGGAPVATSMGFTPLDGLMMGSRPGALDPGLLVYLLRQRGLTVAALDHALNYESGLLGVSGVSADFRQVEEAAKSGDERARLALEMYGDRIRAAIGGLTVTLGGLDALAFTGGVGEHAADLRAEICRGLECVGLQLDAAANARCQPDADVAAADSAGRILVIHTQEERLVAEQARQTLVETQSAG